MRAKRKSKGNADAGSVAITGTTEAGSIAALLSEISQTLKHVDKIVLAIHRSAFALAKRPTPETGSTSPETGSASASPSGNLEQ